MNFGASPGNSSERTADAVPVRADQHIGPIGSAVGKADRNTAGILLEADEARGRTHRFRIAGEDGLQQQPVQVPAMNLQHRHAVLLDHLPDLDHVEDLAGGVVAAWRRATQLEVASKRCVDAQIAQRSARVRAAITPAPISRTSAARS